MSEPEPPLARAKAEPLVIVVIDDDEIDRLAARRALEGMPTPVIVEEYSLGFEGAERLVESGADCVLLDYSLPGFDGFELLAHLESAGVDLPIIMMTGLDGDEELVVEALRRGAYDYLSKSRVDSETLYSKIQVVRRLNHARAKAQGARAQLQAANTELRQAVAARDSVLAVVSHDLRGPLNNIKLSMGLLGSKDEAHRRLAVQSISRAVDRSERLIQDLLDVARLQGGRLELEHGPSQTRELVEAAVADVRPTARGAGCELDVTIDDAVATLEVDRHRIVQVLDNLLRNAVKYGPEGGRIVVEVGPGGGGARFAVSDEGPGVAAEDAEQVFERFWQADDRPASSGSGLGLAIAKSIVERHGGTIGVQPGALGGAEFFFVLPKRKGESLGEAPG